MQFKVVRASDGKKKRKDAPCAGAFQVGDSWHVKFIDWLDVADLIKNSGHTVTMSLVKDDELTPILTINDK